MLDEIYHDILRDVCPAVYDAVKTLVELGQSPGAIASRTEARAARDSLLPALVEGAAKTIKAQSQEA